MSQPNPYVIHTFGINDKRLMNVEESVRAIFDECNNDVQVFRNYYACDEYLQEGFMKNL